MFRGQIEGCGFEVVDPCLNDSSLGMGRLSVCGRAYAGQMALHVSRLDAIWCGPTLRTIACCALMKLTIWHLCFAIRQIIPMATQLIPKVGLLLASIFCTSGNLYGI